VAENMSREDRRLTLEELKREAARAWRELRHGSIVWLVGELGAGKTAFAKGVLEAAGAAEARSPTFSLINEYLTPEGPVFHADCYRLRDPAEAVDLDFPDIERKARLLLIEWPEKGGHFVPPATVTLRFSHCDDPERRLMEQLP